MALKISKKEKKIKKQKLQNIYCKTDFLPITVKYLSAINNSLFSIATLLNVFHIASVSGDISNVSKNEIALRRSN